jgi:two-component system sensor histidine kinase AlgZ
MSKPDSRGQNAIELAEHFFLPSFCEVRIVFAVVVIAELLAFILALVSPGLLGDPWSDLGLISLFMQWIALTSAALLCISRPLLSRLGNTAAAIVSYLLVLLVTGIVSEVAFWLMMRSTLFNPNAIGNHALFLFRNLTISTVVAAIVLRYLYVQFQWRQQIQAESRARIQALQARIRPHFLFNSMNTIAALTRSEPAVAETAIEDLSDLFRAALDTSHEQTSLGDEMVLAQRYLNIERLRLGERLAVEWDMDAVPRDLRVPLLILQPLLENAIYHSIEMLPKGGTIRITGESCDGMVHIRITNPVPETGARNHQDGNHIAQENIRQRLQIAFGAKAGLDISILDGLYQVTLFFPENRLS